MVRLYTYFTEKKIIFEKKFVFRAGHSTDNALLELIDQIRKCFNEKSIFQKFLLPYQSFRYRRSRENKTKIRKVWNMW